MSSLKAASVAFGLRTRFERLFLVDGLAMTKARWPNVLGWWRGTCSRFGSVEWRCLWPDSGTQWCVQWTMLLKHNVFVYAWSYVMPGRNLTEEDIFCLFPFSKEYNWSTHLQCCWYFRSWDLLKRLFTVGRGAVEKFAMSTVTELKCPVMLAVTVSL